MLSQHTQHKIWFHSNENPYVKNTCRLFRGIPKYSSEYELMSMKIGKMMSWFFHFFWVVPNKIFFIRIKFSQILSLCFKDELTVSFRVAISRLFESYMYTIIPIQSYDKNIETKNSIEIYHQRVIQTFNDTANQLFRHFKCNPRRRNFRQAPLFVKKDWRRKRIISTTF